jgi:uncharacterized protein
MDDVRDGPLAAGDFASWVVGVQDAIAGGRDSDVPCHGCTACCTSSQFVHIEPDETETLAHIPAELLFPAPRAPRGHVLLGYDERGHCPMLVDGGCSIYEHRPRTCRTYDCRVFAAAGVEVDDDQAAIRTRVRRWEFTFPGSDDRARHDAVRAATGFLRAHRADLGEQSPADPTRLAVAATRVHDLFLTGPAPNLEAVRAALRRRDDRPQQ